MHVCSGYVQREDSVRFGYPPPKRQTKLCVCDRSVAASLDCLPHFCLQMHRGMDAISNEWASR